MKKTAVALLCNPASVHPGWQHALKNLDRSTFELTSILAPQHGFMAHTQANMVESAHTSDENSQLPIYSLYSETRKPTAEMLRTVDAVVVDLQDVGVRGYTFVWSMLLTMEACASLRKKLIVVDRPNPLGGLSLEGPLLQEGLFSFVGMHAIPIRHGMTLGELAQMFKKERHLDVELEIQAMSPWKRSSHFEQTEFNWVMPSPNMPTLDTVFVYPGMELFEGTNISEGRGTTRPFEFFGAPFIKSHAICDWLNQQQLPGVHFRAASFEPTFDKWQGRLCHGGQIHVTDRQTFASTHAALAILQGMIKFYGGEFVFNNPPYEYEEKEMPFDILVGNRQVRQQLHAGRSWREIVEPWKDECSKFNQRRQEFLLY